MKYIILTNLILLFTSCDTILKNVTEHDNKVHENSALLILLNEAIDNQINQHTQSTFHPGFIETSRDRTIKYINSIAQIETYARHGVMSNQPRNNILLKITFNTGIEKSGLYTGLTAHGLIGPKFLLLATLENGKAKKVFTNGVELNGSPKEIIPDLNAIIKAAIMFDINTNRHYYFGATPTAEDYKKQWDSLR